MKTKYLFVYLLIAASVWSKSAIAINITTLGTAYTENFDSLASSGTSSTVPSGWAFSEAGGNTTYTAGTGSSATGDTYSFGVVGTHPVSDRAFGELTSGTVSSRFGAEFKNLTGVTVTSLLISYYGEQWRWGATGRTGNDTLGFEYSVNATSLTTGNWTAIHALDFSSLITTGGARALDGNADANRKLISDSIAGLTIDNGMSFWLRWVPVDVIGSDDGLAVDDFSLTANGALSPDGTTVPDSGSSALLLAVLLSGFFAFHRFSEWTPTLARSRQF